MANQNVTQLTQQTGTAAPSSLFYAVVSGATDTGLPLSVLFNSPAFTGVPTTTTAAVNTNTTQIASCAYVINQGYLTSAAASSTYAPITNPTFIGTVVIPTVTLSGGTINGTTIGATTASTGAFTTLNTTGLATLNSLSTASATVTGGTINGTSVGATTTSTGAFTTVTASNTITPSQVGGIVGTNTNNNAQAGSIGEFVTSSVVSGSAVPLTNATSANVTSISLTAGDWDVWANAGFLAAGTTTIASIAGGISTTSATLPGNAGTSTAIFSLGVALSTGASPSMPTGTVRLSLAATTTVFLVVNAGFAVSTLGGFGTIAARRRR